MTDPEYSDRFFCVLENEGDSTNTIRVSDIWILIDRMGCLD
jgi:hypothetical protein